MHRKRNGEVFWLLTHSPANYFSSSLSPLASHRMNRVGKSQRSAQTGRLEESEEEEEENSRSDRSIHIHIVADNVSVLMCWKTKIKTKQSEFYGKSKT